jgi:anthranilate phosphoribosyltransferase
LEIRDGSVTRREVGPADFDVASASMADLQGGDAHRNAEIARAVLDGRTGPQRDIVLVNASAALVAAGKASGFLEGMELARHSIDSGAARGKLEELARFSQAEG